MTTRARFLFTATAFASTMVSTTAVAQDVVMRRPVSSSAGAHSGGATGSPSTPTPTPTPTPATTPTPTPPVTGTWSIHDDAPAPTCATDVEMPRTVTCVDAGGDVLPDSACAADGDKPAATTTVTSYTGCTYSWSEGAFTPWSTTCGTGATRTREVDCVRSTTPPSVAGDGECTAALGGTVPDRTQGPTTNVSDCSALLADGSFENGGTAWGGKFILRPTPVRTGASSALITSSGGPGDLSQTISTTPGWTYTVTYYAQWTDQNTAGYLVSRAVNTANGNIITNAGAQAAKGTWTANSFSFTATGPQTTIHILLNVSGGSYRDAIDDVSIAVTATN